MRNKIQIMTALALLWMWALPAKAQESDTLNRYLQVAAENNPQVKARFNEYYAALERVPQVGALPDPQAMFGYYIMPVETGLGTRTFDVDVSQSFPWFGTLKARKDEASQRAAARYQAFLQEKNDLFFDVKTLFYRLYAVQAAINITREYLTVLERDERVALSRVESGRASMADVLRVQMENKERTEQLESLQDDKETLAAEFNALLNRPVNETVLVPDTIPLLHITQSQQAMADSIIARNPALQILRQQEEASESSIEVARKEGMPSFGLGLSYAAMTPRNNVEMPRRNGQDMLMPMASISIPLNRSKYKAQVREAEFMRESIRNDLVNTENQLHTELVQAVNQNRDARRKVELYRQLVQQAQQTLNIITSAYTGGEESYEELLRMEQQILNYQLELEYARATQNTAVARLQRLMASEIE